MIQNQILSLEQAQQLTLSDTASKNDVFLIILVYYHQKLPC